MSEKLQFANLTWQERWNRAEAVAGISQDGADVMATGFFGVLRFRLDDDASVKAIVSLSRLFATMVENTKKDYDQGRGYVAMLKEEEQRRLADGGEPCGAS